MNIHHARVTAVAYQSLYTAEHNVTKTSVALRVYNAYVRLLAGWTSRAPIDGTDRSAAG